MRVAGLFAGIGGLEEGFRRALGEHAVETTLLCEWWHPAQQVLRERFPDVPLHADIRTLPSIPRRLDVLTAGFPCTDLSQAGRTAGIRGDQSGLVARVFELLARARSHRQRLPEWLVIENVPNMLALNGGEAMRYLVCEIEQLGYRWAYRVVDSRFAGLPQRRRRVLLVAGRNGDPRDVLFADDAGERSAEDFSDDSFGFYWTEGRGGLGWAQDATPTLKGGSTIGIPSPPGIWVPDNQVGRKLLTPTVEDAEELQGFARGWTSPADEGRRNGPRWKLVGNAVSADVAAWLGGRLAAPGCGAVESVEWRARKAWPTAAWGELGSSPQAAMVSEFPIHRPYRHLTEVIDVDEAPAVSHRGANGFWSRLRSGNLGRHPGFRDDVHEHVEVTREPAGLTLAV